MTIRETVSSLREEMKETSADSVLSNRHLWNAFWRSSRVLLQREADANKLRDQNVYDVLMVDTEEVNMFEGTCVPLDCVVCRAKIPKPLMSKSGFIYNFIGSPDLSTSYSVVSPFEFPIKAKIKGTKEKYAYLEGEYIFFSKCVPCVKIVGLFEEFDDTDTKGLCSIMDRAVNIPDYLIEGAMRMAKENLGIFLQKQQDHVPNKDTKS